MVWRHCNWRDQFRERIQERLHGGDVRAKQEVKRITRHGERRIERTGQPAAGDDAHPWPQGQLGEESAPSKPEILEKETIRKKESMGFSWDKLSSKVHQETRCTHLDFFCLAQSWAWEYHKAHSSRNFWMITWWIIIFKFLCVFNSYLQ